MKARQAILALLITVTATGVAFARLQHSTADRKLGTLTVVVDASEDELGAFHVVISKSGTIQKELITNESKITTQLPAGSYTAYVKPPNGQLDHRVKLAPFLVEGAAELVIHLDPLLGSAYCTPNGTRVIPVRTSDNSIDNLKNLSKSKFQVIYLNHKIAVIEYCEMSNNTQYAEYKSPIVTYDVYRAESDKATYSEQLKTIESSGRVIAVQNGQVEERPRVTLFFDGGRVMASLTGGPLPMVKGDGSIKSGAGKATFDFKLDRFGIVKFQYEDRDKGLKLQSRKHDSLVLAEVSKDGITFSGSAVVTGSDIIDEEKIVNFTVTLKDYGVKNKSQDHFSIIVPTLNYNASERITSGDIKVSDLPKTNPGVARVVSN
jgi:hypothetical protein